MQLLRAPPLDWPRGHVPLEPHCFFAKAKGSPEGLVPLAGLRAEPLNEHRIRKQYLKLAPYSLMS